MPQPSTRPTFLPLTTAAAATPDATPDASPSCASLHALAVAADTAAADCWVALLAGCDTPGRRELPARLRALTDAAVESAGDEWWRGAGSHLRRRLHDAQRELIEAVRDDDGAEFAEAFVGYDQAVATTVVAVLSREGSPA